MVRVTDSTLVYWARPLTPAQRETWHARVISLIREAQHQDNKYARDRWADDGGKQ